MAREKRRYRRERILAEVSYQDEKNQTVGGCIAKDISEGGVCIKIKQFFPVGTILGMQFKLPLSPEPFNVKGKIKWINKSAYNEEWEVGLEILEDRHYHQLVQRYIYLKNPSPAEEE